jgi:uncharacterized membrane protein
MPEILDYISILSRWLHIAAGITWIGMLYFFNFVNGPFVGTMDGDTKKKVIPELAPRALYWFRWGAAFTWFYGVIMLVIIFHYGNASLGDPSTGWSGIQIAIQYAFLVIPFIYDFLAKTFGKNIKVFAVIGFVGILGLYCLYSNGAAFGYRGYLINIGVALGTIMAYNVWFRIWPAQKKIISGIKSGTPADAAIVTMAGARSRHNVYMSVPLLWTMINSHSAFGVFANENGWIAFAAIVLLSWFLVAMLYKKATKVPGF